MIKFNEFMLVLVAVVLVTIAIFALLGKPAHGGQTCYYTNGKTVCCWKHVNGRDYVCN